MSTQQLIKEAGALSPKELHDLIDQLIELEHHKLSDQPVDHKSAVALFKQLQHSVGLNREDAEKWKRDVVDARD